jgi:phage recombination protein Bet
VTALLAADRCPACQCVHGQPTDWPVCPEHGHWLFVASGPLNTGVWTYACQAPKCQHTHTQREKATMTTAHENNRAALAIRGDQDMFTPKQLAMLAQLGIGGAPKPELAVFLYRCQVTGLDPFTGQITMIKRREKVGQDEWQDKWTIQTGIDGYRVIARRAARDAGVVLSYGDTVWYDADGHPHDVWVDPEQPPAAAKVVVYCDGKPFPGVARFKSFAAYTRGGKLMANWATMPEHMIAKCAEAQALRRAFPQDLEGVFTSDETAHNGARAPHFSAQQVPHPPPRQHPQPEPPEPDPGALKDNIGAQFHRLGIDDGDERDAYVRLLTGEDDLAALTIEDLAGVVAKLESCDDIGHLNDITGDQASEPPF